MGFSGGLPRDSNSMIEDAGSGVFSWMQGLEYFPRQERKFVMNDAGFQALEEAHEDWNARYVTRAPPSHILIKSGLIGYNRFNDIYNIICLFYFWDAHVLE